VEAKNTSLDRDILAISRTTVSQFSQPAIDDKRRARADAMPTFGTSGTLPSRIA
jgi:hypothetical protein